jgi:hypothetical protein
MTHSNASKAESRRKLIHRLESGTGGVSFMVIGYTYILFIVLAFVYDFSSVALVQNRANSAVLIAAQELAKNVDRNRFLSQQQVRVRPSAVNVGAAQTHVSNVYGSGGATVTSATIESRGPIDVVIVTAQVRAPVPLLQSVFGISPFTIRVRAIAEPAFGIDDEVQ